jgi:hypothetical protein
LPQGMVREVRGAQAVAEQALANSQRARFADIALVNSAPCIVVGRRGKLERVLRFTIRNAKITAIDVIADPSHLRKLDLKVLDTNAEGRGN